MRTTPAELSYQLPRPERAHKRQRLAPPRAAATGAPSEVTLLDYGAGNVRSVRNALKRIGYSVKDVGSITDIQQAEKLVFPGVGAFEQAMGRLKSLGYKQALKDYIVAGRPFLGICLGLHVLYEGSDENGGVEGLGILPGRVTQFDAAPGLPVPHIGWNDLQQRSDGYLLSRVGGRRVYFVHSFRATPSPETDDYIAATSDYGGPFVAALQRGNLCATQFHPEKSGAAGLDVLKSFLDGKHAEPLAEPSGNGLVTGLAKRVIACLDVRANDKGDLVVTKGDQYDVRESSGGRDVRNLGAPVQLAGRYFAEGADEVTFLNITGFRDFPLGDMPMLEVLRQTSEGVFVPLTVGGGIRAFTDGTGKYHSALDVAAEYFRSGADKVSIGSDAVDAAEDYMRTRQKGGQTSIEQISWAYGAQAVVVSIDPRRVYVKDPAHTARPCVKTALLGPEGQEYCWWQCTVKGGREGRDIDATELAQAAQALGAGELLLNCIDRDGQGEGFDTELIDAVSKAVTIPVIASSGAGQPSHFSEVFDATGAAAALAAGIFHRKEVEIQAVKAHMAAHGIPTRIH